MEVCLIIMAFCMLAEGVLIGYLYYTLKNVMENQLIQSENILSIINVIGNLNEGVETLTAAELRRAKKEMDKKRKKKTREE